MSLTLLQSAIFRHLEETGMYIALLRDDMLLDQASTGLRSPGEIVMHLVRSLEYYLQGLVLEKWENLPYLIEEYNTAEKIQRLYEEVSKRVLEYSKQLTEEHFERVYMQFHRTATGEEIMLETIEHSLHHRGQLAVYFRLFNLVPPQIDYII